MTSIPTPFDEDRREYFRDQFRSDLASVFWSAIQLRKRTNGFTMQQLADALGRDKSVVSKWFSNEPSNWQADTIADIADALGLDLVFKAKERGSDVVHTPFGIEIEGKQPTPTTTRGNDHFYRYDPNQEALSA